MHYLSGHISDNYLQIELIVNLFSSVELNLILSFHLCCAGRRIFHPIVFNSTQSQLYINYFKELEAVLSKALSLTAHAEENGEAQDALLCMRSRSLITAREYYNTVNVPEGVRLAHEMLLSIRCEPKLCQYPLMCVKPEPEALASQME